MCPTLEMVEMTKQFKEGVRQISKSPLRDGIQAFENLAAEIRAVGHQLT
jgi:hypothetical protein